MFLHESNDIPVVHRGNVHLICTVWALRFSCRAESVVSLSSSSSVGPMANATDVLQPSGLIVLTLSPRVFGHSHVRRQMPPTSTMTREILVAKGGTMWLRINR